MTYTKTVWNSGDIVTSTKLNKIENQLESLSNNGAFIINGSNTSDDNGRLDKTFAEIKAAFESGLTCLIKISAASDGQYYGEAFYLILSMGETSSSAATNYALETLHGSWYASSLNDYPEHQPR